MQKRQKTAFPACMFIGIGIGFLLIPWVGGAGLVAAALIGMGVGFFHESFLRPKKPEPTYFKIPIVIQTYWLALAGVGLIAIGIILFIAPQLFWPYLVAVIFIVLGLSLLLFGVKK